MQQIADAWVEIKTNSMTYGMNGVRDAWDVLSEMAKKAMIKCPNQFFMKNRNPSEDSLQKSVCDYIKMQYPKVLFTSDASGVRLTMGQAVKMKNMKSCAGWPDLFIAEPRGKYNGLFIELKKEGEKIFKKDNETPKSDHIADQIEMIQKLKDRNYFADFSIGFNWAKEIIDWYLKLHY